MSDNFVLLDIYRDSLLKSIKNKGGGEGGGCDCDMTSYLLKTDADIKYQVKGNYTTLSDGPVPYTQLPDDIKPDLSAYLKKEDADNKYQEKGSYATKNKDGYVPYDQLPPDIGQGGDLSDYLKKSEAQTTYQVKGNYATTDDLNNNVKKLVKLEQIPVSFYDEINSFDSLKTYIKGNTDEKIDIEGKLPGTEYDTMSLAELEALKQCYNTYYRVRPDRVEFYEPNDYLYVTCPDLPIIGLLFVFSFENPTASPPVPIIRGFAHFFTSTDTNKMMDWFPRKSVLKPEQNNCDWDSALKRFRIKYNYSAGWRIHPESFKLFFFSKLPDYAPLDMCSISTSLVIANDKGKSNGIVPLNESGKIHSKYLPKELSSSTQEPNNTNEINPDLQKYLDEEKYSIGDKYKAKIIDAQKYGEKLTDFMSNIRWPGITKISFQSTRLIREGSVIEMYIKICPETHKTYIIFYECTESKVIPNMGSQSINIEYDENGDYCVYTIDFNTFSPCTLDGVKCDDTNFVEGSSPFGRMWCYGYKTDLAYGRTIIINQNIHPKLVYAFADLDNIGTITTTTSRKLKLWTKGF